MGQDRHPKVICHGLSFDNQRRGAEFPCVSTNMQAKSFWSRSASPCLPVCSPQSTVHSPPLFPCRGCSRPKSSPAAAARRAACASSRAWKRPKRRGAPSWGAPSAAKSPRPSGWNRASRWNGRCTSRSQCTGQAPGFSPPRGATGGSRWSPPPRTPCASNLFPRPWGWKNTKSATSFSIWTFP